MRVLTNQELDEISELSIRSIENFIYSRVSKKEIFDLDINVELHYEDGLDVDMNVNIQFDPLSNYDESIAEDAIAHAYTEIDSYMANEINVP